MLSLRNFWRRHKRKVFVTVGALGSGYVLYKLYDAYRQRVSELERQLEEERETDELIKAQLQDHFESIQRIADSTTLPYAIHHLRNRISEELDHSHLMERLMQGKGQPNTLTSLEKLELWERLKILSFTRMVLSLWAMTMLTLYIRVQVNILGRHLYIETAQGMGSSHLRDEDDPFDKHGKQEFLATADYLSNSSMNTLIPNMESAVAAVLKGKQLREPFSIPVLRDTIIQILETFKNMESNHHWVTYLVPENAVSYEQLRATSSNVSEHTSLPDISKLDQLMMETRAVLSSAEFGNVVEISLGTVVDALIKDVAVQAVGSQSIEIPLAKLLPRVAQMGLILLEEPSENRFVLIIRNLPEVEMFFTLLYSNMPSL